MGVGLLIRLTAAATLTKIDALTTQGIYAVTRNPLYFGSLIVGLGFGSLGGQWIWLVVCAVLFGWIYRLIIVAEERFLAARYGAEFAEYCQRVPCLFPTLSRGWGDVLKNASLDTLQRNNELRNVKATFAFLLLMMGKLWWLPVGGTWWTGRIAP